VRANRFSVVCSATVDFVYLVLFQANLALFCFITLHLVPIWLLFHEHIYYGLFEALDVGQI